MIQTCMIWMSVCCSYSMALWFTSCQNLIKLVSCSISNISLTRSETKSFTNTNSDLCHWRKWDQDFLTGSAMLCHNIDRLFSYCLICLKRYVIIIVLASYFPPSAGWCFPEMPLFQTTRSWASYLTADTIMWVRW